MATKKPAVDPQKKLLITAMKKTIVTNPVLPILEDVLFTKKHAIVTDLETSVSIPYKLPGVPATGVAIPAKMFQDILDMGEIKDVEVDKDFGVTITDGKRKCKLIGENPDNFPITVALNNTFKSIGTFGEQEMEKIKEAISFASNDDLRPAMTGIYFHKKFWEKEHFIVATDAHRLFFKPFAKLDQSFILPPKAARILLALGGKTWKVYGDGGYETRDGKIVMKQPTKKENVPVQVKFAVKEEDGTETFYRGTREKAEQMFAKQTWDSFEEFCRIRLEAA